MYCSTLLSDMRDAITLFLLERLLLGSQLPFAALNEPQFGCKIVVGVFDYEQH
jgi:hypothetical protein